MNLQFSINRSGKRHRGPYSKTKYGCLGFEKRIDKDLEHRSAVPPLAADIHRLWRPENGHKKTGA